MGYFDPDHNESIPWFADICRRSDEVLADQGAVQPDKQYLTKFSKSARQVRNMPVIEISTQSAVGRLTKWRACLLAAVCFLIPGTGLQAADAAIDRIIAECAIDAGSLAECVKLNLEQAEATLRSVEDSWQNLLLEQGLQSTDEETRNPESEQDPTQDKSSNIIAIVNDVALQTGVSTGANPVINVDRSGDAEDPAEEELFDTSVDLEERFGFLPALFRSYRDQQCAWQSSMFGNDRTHLYYQACLAALTKARSQELTHYLAVQRSRARSGQFFRGFYTKIETGALFQSCDRSTNWWVTGAESVLAALDRQFLDIKSQSLTNGDLLYAEVRGEVGKASEGPAANFSSALSVHSIGILRPVAHTDCEYRELPGQNLYTALESDAQSAEQSTVATVDDYASSGFLYGYFNFWIAACSVTENSVCSAETEAQFASDGDWQLRIDRSLEGDWRIKLVPTTDDQLIEKQLTLQINGSDVFLNTDYPQPMQLALNQGVEIANGELARELVGKLKLGRELRLQWFNDADVMSELKFSLLGVTRALDYFDSVKS